MDNKTKFMEDLSINFPKYMQGLYAENHKTLTKECNEDSNKWRHILVFSWIGRLNTFKMSILP